MLRNMSARTAGAVVAAVMFVPAVAKAQPQTITITTTTTVTLVPDATISDAPPGETPPNTVPFAARRDGIDRGFRFSAGLGTTLNDKPLAFADLRIGWALVPHLLVVGGLSIGGEADDIAGKPQDLVHALTGGLQWWPLHRLWIEGGAGELTTEHRGPMPVATVAVGYELFTRPGYSLGANVRGLAGDHDGGAILLVGASWY